MKNNEHEIIQEKAREYCKHIKLLAKNDAKQKKRQTIKKAKDRMLLKHTLKTQSSNYAGMVYTFIMKYLSWESIQFILHDESSTDMEKYQWFCNIYIVFRNQKIENQITFF